MFEALVAEARREHWFIEGEVPDTIDGRFAVLSTILALATVRLEGGRLEGGRLERGGPAAHEQAVALVERFVEAMDAEHRQLGIGEPGIGKKVRRLVGALARRVELWRGAVGGGDWDAAVNASLFPTGAPSGPAVDHCKTAIRECWARLEASSEEAMAEGTIG